jgi:hypothetical protein
MYPLCSVLCCSLLLPLQWCALQWLLNTAHATLNSFPSAMVICVIHVRVCVRAWLNAYRRAHAGMTHTLVMIRKPQDTYA